MEETKWIPVDNNDNLAKPSYEVPTITTFKPQALTKNSPGGTGDGGCLIGCNAS